MSSPCRIATAYGALLEVTFQDVATRKRIVTKDAGIWPVSGVYKGLAWTIKEALQLTYVAKGAASNALHGDMFFGSEDRGICHHYLSMV